MSTCVRDADVAVIGAGPSGCAAAITLAGAGASVVLVERAVPPRDKACGDGLLPDAWDALVHLGVGDAVRERARLVRGIAFVTPRGRSGFVPVMAGVLPRSTLDQLLVREAARCGTDVLDGTLLEAVADGGRTVRLRTVSATLELRVDFLVLATGAAARPLRLSGLPGPSRAPAAATRGYAVLADLPGDVLRVDFSGAVGCGYRWAFPVGDGRWNVGCGMFRRGPRHSLAAEARAYVAELGGAGWENGTQGGALRTHFPEVEVVRDRILAVGDAAGLTRPLSGEGIGPSLTSGILAGRAVLGGGKLPAAAYQAALRQRYARDFRAWRLGEILGRFPALVEFIVSRVAAAPKTKSRIKEVLANRAVSGSVLSPVGIARALLGR